jgi:hypothetical protein
VVGLDNGVELAPHFIPKGKVLIIHLVAGDDGDDCATFTLEIKLVDKVKMNADGTVRSDFGGPEYKYSWFVGFGKQHCKTWTSLVEDVIEAGRQLSYYEQKRRNCQTFILFLTEKWGMDLEVVASTNLASGFDFLLETMVLYLLCGLTIWWPE